MRKPTKTISGVTPLAVVIKPRKCKHGTCIYCPFLNVPQSYTPKSPAIIRAKNLNYNPIKQIQSRLKAFESMGHNTDKIELIVMGGTFLDYPIDYQYSFIKDCFDALNEKKSKNLEQAKKFNETSKHRCVALCIETRPDVCSEQEIQRILDFGCTRVELGVQIVDDKIYKKINRGHTVKEVVQATQLLKDSCFKVGYHIMPALPGVSFKQDIKLFKKLFSDERFKPDHLKIYPTQVILGSELARIYEQGKYKVYSDEKLIELVAKLKENVPEYCRIMRIMREIPPSYLVAGTKRIDLRKEIQLFMKKHGEQCKCIRCREIGFAIRDKKFKKIDNNLRLKKTIYKASKGKEIFLQIVNKQNIIFALCRLRIPFNPFISELKNSLLVRELHVYGPAIKIDKESGNKEFQHKGLGKWLMSEVEKIAKQHKIRNIAIISGVGVRGYYKKLGYKFKENYMVRIV